MIDDRGILFAPRFGAAYRISDKTVIRTGAGVFYDRFQGNPVFDMLPNPPSTNVPQFYYGQLNAIPPASAGVYFPATVVGFDKNGQVPTMRRRTSMPFGFSSSQRSTAEPNPYQPGSIRRHWAQLKTQGMARRSSIRSDALREAGRLPILRPPISAMGVACRKKRLKPSVSYTSPR